MAFPVYLATAKDTSYDPPEIQGGEYLGDITISQTQTDLPAGTASQSATSIALLRAA
jgi:hypothetical protein